MISDDNGHHGMRIGELARRTEVSTRSLRYYEQHGLLTAHRGQNGYRRYHNDVVPLVVNLRRLLSAGLSIADIQQFAPCLANPDLDSTPCTPALEVYEQRLRILDKQISTLTHLRDTLATQANQLRARTNRPKAQ